MNFQRKEIKATINPAYLRLPIAKASFDNFCSKLVQMKSQINTSETEEHNKNILRDFLQGTFYNEFPINTSGNVDLAIFNGKNSNTSIGVIFELKSPQNTSSMITCNDLNRKALHELVLYYLQEKISQGNHTIKHLIATNCLDWFIFDASDFERIFARNSDFVKKYNMWKTGQYDETSTDFFYNQIVKPFISQSNEAIPGVYINLRDISPQSSEDKFIELFKFLSPQHLLKLPFANDNNSLNQEFYDELLYIIGLQEVKQGNILIKRLPQGERQPGSLIENTIEMLQKCSRLGENLDEEQIFEIALELVITWLNRILFLKLLEGLIATYHPEDPTVRFLNHNVINDYDALHELFFDVLAVPPTKRAPQVQQHFNNVPFLNSSLFELTDYEKQYFSINELKDRYTIPIFTRTVLKDATGNRITGEKRTLDYLLEFLDAFNFGSTETSIVQEQPKSIINAAVLGLIFEKVNGYRDGSFFTPGAITMFMARISIRPAITSLFNKHFNWNANSFEDLPNYINQDRNREKILEYNKVFDSIRICDPAVGSGHFLVSCLNELIACKSELGILADSNGKTLPIKAQIENDELVLYDNEGKLFVYKPNDIESARIQKTIFQEKLNLIENCLFGVDINPKSAYITRLRLWIELLKNTYYNDDGQLETLPNIDLNIKIGDSLLSSFTFDDSSVSQYNAQLIKHYKQLVKEYKNTTDRQERHSISQEIENIKFNLRRNIISRSSRLREIQKLENELEENLNKLEFHKSTEFLTAKDVEDIKTKISQLKEKIAQLKQENQQEEQREQEIRRMKYLEWRLEFPEVLDDDGKFVGFHIIIGNPPYIQLQRDGGKLATLYQPHNYQTFSRTGDIYTLFYERGLQLLQPNGFLCFITSNKWMRAGYGEKLRNFFTKQNPLLLVDLGPGVFESATVDTNILLIQKCENQSNLRAVTIQEENNVLDIEKQLDEHGVILSNLGKDAWFIGSGAEQRLKEKIERIGKPLKEWDVKIYRGILTGLNEAFIITTEKRDEILANCRDDASTGSATERQRTEAIIKPILRGRDIKRYYYEWAGLWVIVIPAGWTNANKDDEKAEVFIEKAFPSLMNHLKEFEEKARKRDDQGDYWWELRKCAYYPEFEKEKVVWGGVITTKEFFKLRMSYLEKGVYINAPANMMICDNIKYILGFCNSYLNNWYYNNFIGTVLHKDGIRFYLEDILKIPIPPITVSNQGIVSQIEGLVEKILSAKKHASTSSATGASTGSAAADTQAWEREIDRLVYKLYDLTEEEIKIVEQEK